MFWTIILFREPGFCFLHNLLDVSTLSLIRPARLPYSKTPLSRYALSCLEIVPVRLLIRLLVLSPSDNFGSAV